MDDQARAHARINQPAHQGKLNSHLCVCLQRLGLPRQVGQKEKKALAEHGYATLGTV